MSRCLHRLGARITPAYAGKRSAWPSVLRRQRDHPRVCGEKLPVRRAAAGRAGSPPRMRGKVAAISAYNAAPGITPAYAGKSTLHRDDAPLSWDHPRVCGEKKRKGNSPHARTGSPPRMRGKVPAGFLEVVQPRITPAYAGKSVISGSLWLSSRDHPRVCGEKCELVFSLVTLLGSPPRMRGKVEEVTPTNETDRITPAYAGKRLCCRVGSRVTGDHPRVCGEKGVPHRGGTRCRGSPPRMRGKGKKGLKKSPRYGITPAYAGKSYEKRLFLSGSWDHPRVCGEKFGLQV